MPTRAPPRRWRSRIRGRASGAVRADAATVQRAQWRARGCSAAHRSRGVRWSPRLGDESRRAPARRRQAHYVVVELVHAALHRLEPVQQHGIVRRVRRSKGIRVEVLAELRHRGAKRKQMAAHVADAITDLGLQRAGPVRVVLLQRRCRRLLCHQVTSRPIGDRPWPRLPNVPGGLPDAANAPLASADPASDLRDRPIPFPARARRT